MALSETKKLRMKRKWVAVSRDASKRYGEILGRYDTKQEAKNNHRLFCDIRLETVEEVRERMARQPV